MTSQSLHPKKLLFSKWTARQPKNKEKHFEVIEVEFDEQGLVIHCVIQSVMTKREIVIDWRDLQDDTLWHIGWQ